MTEVVLLLLLLLLLLALNALEFLSKDIIAYTSKYRYDILTRKWHFIIKI